MEKQSERIRERETETKRTQWEVEEMYTTFLSQGIRHTDKEEQAWNSAILIKQLRRTMWDQAPPAATWRFQHSVTCQTSKNTTTNSHHLETSCQRLSKWTLGTHHCLYPWVLHSDSKFLFSSGGSRGVYYPSHSWQIFRCSLSSNKYLGAWSGAQVCSRGIAS